MARLTAKARKALPRSSFATGPTAAAKKKGAKGSYPIPDAAHARNALARVSQFGSAGQKAQVRAKVKRRFPAIGKGGSRGARMKRMESMMGDQEF